MSDDILWESFEITGTPVMFALVFFEFVLVMWWYIVTYRRNRLISLDGFMVTMVFTIPLVVFSPLAYSPLNAAAVGDINYLPLIGYLPKAFEITAVGLSTFILALNWGRRVRFTPPLVTFISRSYRLIWLSTPVLGIVTSLLGVLAMGLVLEGASFGSARVFATENKSIHSIFIFYNEVVEFALVAAVVNFYIKRTTASALVAIVLIGLSTFLGTRASSIYQVLYAVFIIAIASGYRKISTIVLAGLGALVIALLIGFLRDAHEEGASSAILLEALLYGNNFSDVRDFAWMLSGWDGNLLYGRTYLSGIFSFIPSAVLPIRWEASWAPFSAAVSGLDPLVHPGLRPGPFGEPYFNLGLPGVILVAFCAGIWVGRISLLAERFAREDVPLQIKASNILAAFTIAYFTTYVFFTAGAFSFYVTLGLHIGANLLVGASDIRRSSSRRGIATI